MGQYFSSTYYDANGNKKTKMQYYKIGIIILAIIAIILACYMYKNYDAKTAIEVPIYRLQNISDTVEHEVGGIFTPIVRRY